MVLHLWGLLVFGENPAQVDKNGEHNLVIFKEDDLELDPKLAEHLDLTGELPH